MSKKAAKHMITLTINGKEKSYHDELSVRSLLRELELGDKPVVVELNQQALFPREYEHSLLKDQDKLEIITIAAGG